MNNNPMLTDKVALITGGVRRIGAEIAQALHAEGMRLALHYRSSRKEAQTLQKTLNAKRPDSVVLIQADLLNQNGFTSLVHQTVDHFKQLDVLVNNASAFFPTPIGKADEDDWDALMNTNLKAPFFLSQAAAPFLKRTQGCIINIVDIHAQRPLKEHSIYSISKAGLATLTQSLAHELGPAVRVNGVSPGAILWPESSSEVDDITKQRIISRTFLKRQGKPEDIARTVLFLVRDATYITGQIITVDGGRSLHG